MLSLHDVMHQRRFANRWRWLRCAGAAAFGLGAAPLLRAHEIPERVAIQAYVQAEGTRLRLVLRVPLEAMRDVDFPLRTDGNLDLEKVRALLPDAARLWLANGIVLEADGVELTDARIVATRVSLPNDRAFERFDGAIAHVQGTPLDNREGIRWQQAMFDVLLEYPIASADARLVLRPNLAQLGIRTTSVLRIVRPDGPERVLIYEGNPERIALDPGWSDAAARFVHEGFRHILGGYDHLLFLFCLVLPVRRWRPLVAIITAFTLAHSITLAFAALGYAPRGLWFPPFVEAAIAASIVWLALENLVLTPERLERRWGLAFGFGLVHGFGFSFALGETLQFAGAHRAMALAGFNIGVELGQLLVLAVAIPVLWALVRYVGRERERALQIVGSVVIAHASWHWMAERTTTLAAYSASFTWPVLDTNFLLGSLRVALVATVALAAALGFRHLLRTVWRP